MAYAIHTYSHGGILCKGLAWRAMLVFTLPTYSSITPSIENVDAALGCERLGACHDALGAVDHAPPAGPFHELARRRRIHGRCGEGHGEFRGVGERPFNHNSESTSRLKTGSTADVAAYVLYSRHHRDPRCPPIAAVGMCKRPGTTPPPPFVDPLRVSCGDGGEPRAGPRVYHHVKAGQLRHDVLDRPMEPLFPLQRRARGH
jgi:hypothetical protein